MTRRVRTMKSSFPSCSETLNNASEAPTVKNSPATNTPTSSKADDDMLAMINDLSDLSELSDWSDHFTPPAKSEKEAAKRPLEFGKPFDNKYDQGRIFENDILQFVADCVVVAAVIWLCYFAYKLMFPHREEVVHRCGGVVEPTMAEPSWGCAMAYLRYAHNVRAGLKLDPRKVFEACNITCPGN